MPGTKKLKVTQVRSLIGQQRPHKLTVQTLGLRRIRHSVIHNDSPQIRGMIAKVTHLVKVEEVSD